MTTSDSLLQLRKAAVPQGIGHVTDIVCARAENAELWDLEGRRYIDFAAGIAVLNTGHNHPKVKAAVEAQLQKFSHTCFHVALYPDYIMLADQLNKLAPGSSPKKTMLLSTGVEAVENAIKIARAATGRSGIVSFSGAFHGRTMMGMALTGKVIPYKAGFGPFPSEVFHASYPHLYHGISVEDSLISLNTLFKVDVDPSRVAAIILEPVQGEGGFNIAPPAFLQELRKICDAHGILLIIDEIQTGFARTGRMFATEYAGIEPDLMTMAKGIAGGFPLSAVTGKAEIMDAAPVGGLGGTYAGSPIGCAAALAVLEVIEQENLCERAQQIGKVFVDRLGKFAHKERIGDIRHLGAMIAIELVRDGDADKPDAELARALVAAGRKKGLILLSCGTRGNVIRFLPPLTISDALIHEGLDILENCFDEVETER
ncbi:4-aminobutyrate--2-oxoglutarate transaminase [Luteithermobacter gelatinilyticus]|uniref:4-aminobutyrate--2-oxoglutarate transaminase n=1 Tax=Luteithermobacter gelatinilyticus TaxID=2582913 RepID=UPI001105A7AB|nr:4-aminobutyrate--2-oxoglutarate transaminase [Luteithermobacter gelatinilyticus]